MKRAIIITGPTASGKTSAAIRLARTLHTDIVSADSRQVFTDIPIATAMPTAEERSMARHHLIDFLPLESRYSAADFESDALGIMEGLFREHDDVVVCGGSMLYVDALCYGLDQMPTVPDSVRDEVGRELEMYGADRLRMRLYGVDPEYYARADLMNVKRLRHALEVSLTAGVPYSSLLAKAKTERPFRIERYVIAPEREVLFQRIGRRVEAMVEQGLEQEAWEVRHLRHLNSLNTVGLKEMFAYFDGEMDRHTAIERIKKNTRVYAKKQLTWWRRRPDTVTFVSDADALMAAVR